ncbi:MAG: pyridoxamine 5'-phosphate oxidase [Ignavibacteriaceae bacterium]
MLNNQELANLRRTWSTRKLDENSVNKNPVEQFSLWMTEAIEAQILDPNAMTLATADKDGIPSARIVLLKGIDEKGLVFFTNYGSRKSDDLLQNPKAAVVFFWKELERQLRVMGEVIKISKSESEEYFKTRPYESRIGAWASKQSSIVPDRNYLEEKFEETKNKFPDDVPLPDFWGGFRIIPERFEFWQGRESRMHDRIVYIKDSGEWKIMRLAP